MGIRMVLFVSICLLLVSVVRFQDEIRDFVTPRALEIINTRVSVPIDPDAVLTPPDRDLSKLTPETKELALEFLELAEQEWYHLLITEWRRDPERQQALYNQWRTKPGKVVTWTMDSRHLEWIAFDVAFEPAYHGTAYPDDEQLRLEIGELWESLWLIRWWRRRRPDKPHFQYWW